MHEGGSRQRFPFDKVKPPAARASSSWGYCSGEVMTATEAWFFAELRTIAGPPMSICSMAFPGSHRRPPSR